jgi:hypothetical protein
VVVPALKDPRSLLAVILCALAWLYVFPYHRQLNNPNENSRVYLTMAIVDDHTVVLDGSIRRHGWVNDLAQRDVTDPKTGRKQRQLYLGKAPGTSFSGVPAYYLTRLGYARFAHRLPTKAEAIYWLRLLTLVLPSVLFLVWLRRHLLPRVGDPLTAQALVAFGLGTMATPYTMMFASHQHTAIAVFGAFLCARAAALHDRAGEGLGRVAPSLAAAGALTGFAAMSEYPLILAVVSVGVYALVTLKRRLRVAAFVAGGAPVGALLCWYHWKAFGSPLTTPYAHLANPTFATEHSKGFYGLRYPDPGRLLQSLFAPDLGLFAFAPFLLLGLLGAVWLLRKAAVPDRQSDGAEAPLQRPDALLALAFVTLMVLFNASMNNHPGWCVGPRYIAAVTPFLVLYAALVLHRWSAAAGPGAGAPAATRADVIIGAGGGLALVGIVLSGLSGLAYPHFPTQFTNPVFELLLPLLRAGYLPHHAGELVGLPGLAGVVPLVLVLAGVTLLASGAGLRRPLRPGVALLVTALVLLPYSRIGKPSPRKTASIAFVKRTWEPQPKKPPLPPLVTRAR